jgi:thioredoxin-related protein
MRRKLKKILFLVSVVAIACTMRCEAYHDTALVPARMMAR